MSKQGWLLLLLSSSLTVAANLMLRGGLLRAGGFGAKMSELPQAVFRLINQPLFDIGVLFYGLAALFWFKVIETEQLSTAYPTLVSITFFFVTIGAILFFKEPFAWRKVVGAGFIIIGIIIISQTKQ